MNILWIFFINFKSVILSVFISISTWGSSYHFYCLVEFLTIYLGTLSGLILDTSSCGFALSQSTKRRHLNRRWQKKMSLLIEIRDTPHDDVSVISCQARIHFWCPLITDWSRDVWIFAISNVPLDLSLISSFDVMLVSTTGFSIVCVAVHT